MQMLFLPFVERDLIISFSSKHEGNSFVVANSETWHAFCSGKRANAVMGKKIQTADGQTTPVYAVLFHAQDSQVIASLGQDLGLFDAGSGQLIKRLKGHKETVTCLAPLANGGFASGGADKTVIIWSPVGDGVLKYTHSHSIQTLAQEPVSGLLLSGTSGDFGLWSAAAKSVNKTKVIIASF